MNKLKISEIFFSIEGEGPFIGFPSFFIRTFGCNLNCSWCDTPYAKEGSFREMEIKEIITLWENNYSSIPYITLTGGEPLLQNAIYYLIEGFLKKACIIILETNGSISLEKVPKEVVKVMDIKTPSSNMEKYNLYENLKFLDTKDAVKFVIQNRADFEFALNCIEKYQINYYTQVIFSPAFSLLSPKSLAEWILEIKKPIRFQVQIHRIVGIK